LKILFNTYIVNYSSNNMGRVNIQSIALITQIILALPYLKYGEQYFEL